MRKKSFAEDKASSSDCNKLLAQRIYDNKPFPCLGTVSNGKSIQLYTKDKKRQKAFPSAEAYEYTHGFQIYDLTYPW